MQKQQILNAVFNRNTNVYSFVSFNVQQVFVSGWYYHDSILPKAKLSSVVCVLQVISVRFVLFNT